MPDSSTTLRFTGGPQLNEQQQIDPSLTSGWDSNWPIGSGYGSCPAYKFCIWTGTNATGSGYAYGGYIGCGNGLCWRGTIFENNVGSIKNNTTITVDVLNDLGGGTWASVWTSVRGNWGNLPSSARYTADGIGYIRC